MQEPSFRTTNAARRDVVRRGTQPDSAERPSAVVAALSKSFPRDFSAGDSSALEKSLLHVKDKPYSPLPAGLIRFA